MASHLINYKYVGTHYNPQARGFHFPFQQGGGDISLWEGNEWGIQLGKGGRAEEMPSESNVTIGLNSIVYCLVI